MHATITVATPIDETPRVQQVRGTFDLPRETHATVSWRVTLPLEQKPWNVGLIVGPSGCGKSTIARRFWPDEFRRAAELAWPERQSILDAFPQEVPTQTITKLLCAVGFSSPPAWLRPYRVLSTGQQFRATLARLLAGSDRLIVLDEYTSMVDRTVAQLGSAALANCVRQRGQQFVAVTCHEDVADWLQPDWVYRPAEDLFQWRLLQRRPPLECRIVRCQASAWALFRPHHYLNHRLTPSAVCFLMTWREQPVGFSAWLPFVGTGPPARREHRTVTLPDYQGVGMGNALSALVASLWRGLGYRALSTTTHPAMIHSRCRGKLWRMRRAPALAAGGHDPRLRHAATRLTAGFEYVGPAMPRRQAEYLLGR